MADLFQIPKPPISQNDVKLILDTHNLDVVNTAIYFGGTQIAKSKQEAKQASSQNNPYNTIATETSNRVQDKMQNRKAALGGLVFSNLEIPAQSYTDIDNKKIEVPAIRWDIVLFSCYQTNIIVKEALKGSDGTVKEHTSVGDWDVQIRGVFAGKNGDYPFDDVELWTKLVSLKYAFRVNSWYLNMLGISTLVVEGKEMTQEEGRGSVQRWNISASSDKMGELLFL